MQSVLISIDTGGTFTDLAAVDLRTGRAAWHKLPTTPDDASRGILQGIAELLAAAGLAAAEVGYLCHGTTLATNAVLEGKWAPTAMLTTAGFGDVLELARQRRPHFFNLDIAKPVPPAARHCRREVRERIAPDGTVIADLAEDDVRDAIAALRPQGIEAVAICFLHSYANPAHEARAAALLRAAWPDLYICTSSALLPEFREFERFATATVNASLMPVVDRYLERFERGVAGLGIGVAPQVMQSNGGAVSTAAVRRAPVNTFFSGPAGGVIGAAAVSAAAGIGDLITFDMGGTSTDVCLIQGGVPARRNLREMGGFPVRTATLDLHTIGAGGGSIAWIDPGGLLKVGPMSAGAVPGPAAYGRGGARPTVTDANVVLGRLDPTALLGGRMPIDPARAHAAIATQLGAPLGLDVTRAAAGVLDIVNVNMMGAVRVISVEQGEDPRRCVLVPFGGAGPLHAADVAAGMGIGRLLVPPRPGLLSAIGLIHADGRGDFSLTRLVPATPDHLAAVQHGLDGLRQRGAAWLQGEAEGAARAVTAWQIDMRYLGQNHELPIPLPDPGLDAAQLARLVGAFHDRHKAAYGYDLPGQPVEIVTLRLSLTVPHRAPVAGRAAPATAPPAVPQTRPVWFAATGFVATPVYDRAALGAGVRINGPAIVVQMDATTVLPPGSQTVVDGFGNLLVDLPPPAGGAEPGP